MMIRKYVLGWADNKVCDQKQVPTLLLFLTPILILAVLEVNTVHNSLLFDIHCTPGPHLMRIHLVRYSTSARFEKYSIIHLVRPIIHLVRIFALSTSWIN